LEPWLTQFLVIRQFLCASRHHRRPSPIIQKNDDFMNRRLSHTNIIKKEERKIKRLNDLFRGSIVALWCLFRGIKIIKYLSRWMEMFAPSCVKRKFTNYRDLIIETDYSRVSNNHTASSPMILKYHWYSHRICDILSNDRGWTPSAIATKDASIKVDLQLVHERHSRKKRDVLSSVEPCNHVGLECTCETLWRFVIEERERVISGSLYKYHVQVGVKSTGDSGKMRALTSVTLARKYRSPRSVKI